MTESIQMMAQRFNRAFESGGEAAGDAVLDDIFKHHDRDIVLSVLEEAQRQHDFEWQEKQAEHERHLREAAGVYHILAGLPETVTFFEACQVKAAQGDALSQQHLDHFNSREYRLDEALTNAAIELHPGWHMEGHVMCRTDKSAPDVDGELVEWLYKNYPDVAKRIEQEVD